MHDHSPRTDCSAEARRRRVSAARTTASDPAVLDVLRVGYLVPPANFDGTIHSVFARACNIDCVATLVTVVAHELADGPTTLKLAMGSERDLRRLFRSGERLHRRDRTVSTARVELSLAGAAIWHPAPPPSAVCGRQLERRLLFAAAVLKQRRLTHSSVLEREASPVLRSLTDATRRLDACTATTMVDRLVGWGEGLTPAGDDFIVGWYASIDALADGRADRLRFLRVLSGALLERTAGTTAIAAHLLRLAARGHFNDDVVRLRKALLGPADCATFEVALHRALGAGATSGADMVTGIVAGAEAWSGVGFDDGRHVPCGTRQYEAAVR